MISLTHTEIRDILVYKFGLQCWGCDFKARNIRYLELEPIDNKPKEKMTQLDDYCLLCGPCIKEHLTLGALREFNITNRYIFANHPIDIDQAIMWSKISRPKYEFLKARILNHNRTLNTLNAMYDNTNNANLKVIIDRMQKNVDALLVRFPFYYR